MNTTIDTAQRAFWKRLGWASFTFFLLKGLLWLFVPVMMYLMNAAGR